MFYQYRQMQNNTIAQHFPRAVNEYKNIISTCNVPTNNILLQTGRPKASSVSPEAHSTTLRKLEFLVSQELLEHVQAEAGLELGNLQRSKGGRKVRGPVQRLLKKCS